MSDNQNETAEYWRGYKAGLADQSGAGVLQAVLDAIAGTLDTSTEIADHPNVKFAQMKRLELLKRPGGIHAIDRDRDGVQSVCGADGAFAHDAMVTCSECLRQLGSRRALSAQHELKCWPLYFEALQDGRKTFEIRPNDRNYAVGDVLRLREWIPSRAEYTGRECCRRVVYITDFGQQSGYVVMGLTA